MQQHTTLSGQRISVGDVPTPVEQWFAAKTTGDKLNLVFQNISDESGHVEKVKHLGGRDWLVFWSKTVVS